MTERDAARLEDVAARLERVNERLEKVIADLERYLAGRPPPKKLHGVPSSPQRVKADSERRAA
jgi:hypothetical protein